jgi:2-keto-4-pentenoate hydratase/2-oxohepta-3-ene-1,7-dioic acid hydratase in catechol pathway
MRLCRFGENRLGLVLGAEIRDVTQALDVLPAVRWPVPRGDLMIAHLGELRARIEEIAGTAPVVERSEIGLLSPVANPGKIVAAPVNYQLHLDEARADPGINFGAQIKTIDEYGLFLKAPSSLAGCDEGVVVGRTQRRIDHEVELAVVIGPGGRDIAEAAALSHVAGYAIGLDMSVRGTEDRSYRKSLDTFTVLGPHLVTADEIADPGALELELAVNGEVRQASNTSRLIYGVAKLIAYASAAYTLDAGDVILTGTPEGVGPVRPGDTMSARIEGIGRMDVAVRGAP